MFLRSNRKVGRGLFLRMAVLALVVVPAWGMSPSAYATVFGDGANIQAADDRVPLGSLEWVQSAPGSWALASGTIRCDGVLRGSAIILDVDAIGPRPPGHVLASAAHVLFDLDSGARFTHCVFDYLGLGALPGYRATIDLTSARLGDFDPFAARESAAFGRGDWAILYVPERIAAATAEARLRPVDWHQAFDDGAGRSARASMRMLAWSKRHSAISLSGACRALPSRPGDLGGGAWAGQLLDGCDSGEGASGGGLVVEVDGRAALLGIRIGAHWDGTLFPASRFPHGPGTGVRWDVRRNTNFSRAIDQEFLAELADFLEHGQSTKAP